MKPARPSAPLLHVAALVTALLVGACGDRHVDQNKDSAPGIVSLERVTADTLNSTYATPDDWHRLALHGNWDFVDDAVWRTIVMRPDCDRATALAIFWMASPEY